MLHPARLSALILASALLLTGCGGFVKTLTEPPSRSVPSPPTGPLADSPLYDHIMHGGFGGTPEVTVAMRYDLPGFAKAPTGSNTPVGFEATLVTTLIKKLGLKQDQIFFKQLSTATALNEVGIGGADIYIGGTDQDAKNAHLIPTSPYLTGNLGLLYRRSGPVIATPAAAAGKRACVENGSSAQRMMSTLHLTSDDEVTTALSLGECVDYLTGGQVDFVLDYSPLLDAAMTTGSAKNDLALLPLPGSQPSKYVIAVSSDKTFCNVLNGYLRDLVKDGTWQRAFNDNLGSIGIRPQSPPSSTPCSAGS